MKGKKCFSGDMGMNFGVGQIITMVTSVIYAEQPSLGILVLPLFLMISGSTAVPRNVMSSLQGAAYMQILFYKLFPESCSR